MPIKIPNQLPATQTLRQENIFVMTETRAITQDIRPLRILLLNLMPTKVDTETQFARVLGNTPLQIELELVAPRSHVSKNTSQEHMLAFYKTFDEVKDQNFDGLIITGAPVEHLPFEEVDYWPELCRIMAMKPLGTHSMACWKVMTLRATRYTTVRTSAMMPPQGRPTNASVLPKAPTKSPA